MRPALRLRSIKTILFTLLFSLGGVFSAHAAGKGSVFSSMRLSIFWIIPFLGLLFSIALFPLISSSFWNKNYGKIALFWSATTLIALFNSTSLGHVNQELLYIGFHHFFPFIILIGTLYTVTGGLKITLHIPCTPIWNTVVLGVGSLSSSLIGTTGAAMLLIHPFLGMNRFRAKRKHLVIFFIFLVCNIGGALSSWGDPPLFIGYLAGVPLMWPTIHLFKPFLYVWGPLLGIFYCVDRWYWLREQPSPPFLKKEFYDPNRPPWVRIQGGQQILVLFFVLAAILGTGFWRPDHEFYMQNLRILWIDLIRDGILLGLFLLSLYFTPYRDRRLHDWRWAPLVEVAILFSAIFITVSPVMIMLEQGKEGPMSWLVAFLGEGRLEGANTRLYFWLTGVLSAFLDNAPTYLVFLKTTGYEAKILAEKASHLLVSISAGAVFMGALTTIGNAPNLMVMAISKDHKINVPGFVGYMVWSTIFLIPLFLFLTLLIF